MKLYIKYMFTLRCETMVKEELKRLGLQSQHILVDLGIVEMLQGVTHEQREQLNVNLFTSGLQLPDDKKNNLIEKIMKVVTEMVFYLDELPAINYSDFISEKLDYDYTYLSNIFSEIKGVTLQQFIIIQKIERVKELLLLEGMNLTLISEKMHYSSVAHLSNQFKKITGLTPSFFKQINIKRTELENV